MSGSRGRAYCIIFPNRDRSKVKFLKERLPMSPLLFLVYCHFWRELTSTHFLRTPNTLPLSFVCRSRRYPGAPGEGESILEAKRLHV